MREFDPLRILRTLNHHQVEFILIGGLAGNVWGSPSGTYDLDVCPSRAAENVRRLSAALKELEAKRLNFPEGVPDVLDERALALGDTFTLTTKAGRLDCIATPSGTTGYTDLKRTAWKLALGEGLDVWVAPVEELIRMKKAAGRPKDLIEVEILSALKEERDKNPPTD